MPIAVTLSLLVTAPSAWAEDDWRLVPGAHVRVFTHRTDTRGGQETEGTLRSIDASSLTLETGSDLRPRLHVISRDSIARVDLRLAPARRGGGIAFGFAAGFVAGGLLGVSIGSKKDDCPGCGALLTAPVGALMGAVLGGARAPGAAWQEDVLGARSTDRAHVGLATGPDGRGVGVAMTIPLRHR